MQDKSELITQLINKAILEEQKAQPHRDYVGASAIGSDCARKVQYQYFEQEDFDPRILRIFAVGHLYESLAIKWLLAAGFELVTAKPDGDQFGFSEADGKFKGHIDGYIANAPQELGLTYPMLWECKSLNNRSFNHLKKYGVTKSKPQYATQIALYQAYMEDQINGISNNPALLTAINKDNCELYFELVDFNRELAQEKSDLAAKIIKATRASEMLPRINLDPNFWVCRFCSFNKKCFNEI